jgi:pimeloyl-ACP methyl ester carboxylesterase
VIPGAEVVEFRGLGHLMHEEKPDLFAELIADHATAPAHESIAQ